MGARSYLPITNRRLDVFSFGKDTGSANEIDEIVSRFLLRLTPTVVDTIIIQSVTATGGPIFGYDEEIKWPFILSVYDVFATHGD